MISPDSFRHPQDPDDTLSFERMFEEINPDDSIFNGASDVVVLSPKAYVFSKLLRPIAGVRICGTNRPSYARDGASVLDFSSIPGLGVWLPPTRGYDRSPSAGACLEDLQIKCAPLPNINTFSWGAASGPLGSLLYLPHDHELVYEVVQEGTLALPTDPLVERNTAYGILAYVTAPNGHRYMNEQVGVSGAAEPAWNFDSRSVTIDGECRWREAGTVFSAAADLAMAPFVSATDPLIVHTPGRTYEYNSVVRQSGVWNVVFWLGPQNGQPVSGVAGSTPLTDGVPGTTCSDGILTWTRIASNGHLWQCGTAILQPRRHPGIADDGFAILDCVKILNATNNAVNATANDTPPYRNSNFARYRGLSQSGCHGFIRVRGNDVNGGSCVDCQAFGNPELGEPDYGFSDRSLAGWRWMNNALEAIGGAPYVIEAQGGRPAIFGGHFEVSHPACIRIPTFVGGVSGLTVTSDSHIRSLDEGNGIVGIDRSIPSDPVTGALAGTPNMPSGTALGMHCPREPSYYSRGMHTSRIPSLPDHGWADGYDPQINGAVFVSNVLTSEGHTAWKDDFPGCGRQWDSPGRAPSVRYFGKTKAIVIDSIMVDLGPWCIMHRDSLPTTGAWRAGDLIILGDGQLFICVTDGKFGTSAPPTFRQI